ncbi:cupin domain-containing protein [Lewinella sp. IMCC34183]|uniref:cupin domain-containing protein n=1 Tax=Lewinella sp. IMCC34183 TaxID=2248762 RepID=UPI000E23F794|nr:cupin domain-containing protein [Lewinella sp. IMCC34183]
MNRKSFLRTGLAATAGLATTTLSAGHRPLHPESDVILPAKVVASGKGAFHKVLGSEVTLKLTGADTYGFLTMLEDHNAPGVGIPLHVHTREDEVFRVLEGQVEFVLGEETMVLGAGDVAFAPRNIPHSWRVVGDKPARSIMLANPSGIEFMFEELGKLTGGPPDLSKVAEICGRYGISFV